MLGEIIQLEDNLWFIEGELPDDARKDPDPCNVVLYRAEDRLYLMDSSVGPQMRHSMAHLLESVGPVRSFTLLNSHSHLDHICNNDLIHRVQAREKHHYLSQPGMSTLDAPAYFTDLFARIEPYYDPLDGYPADRLRFRMLGILRDLVSPLIGQRRITELFMARTFKKFEPVRDSRDTMQPYEAQPRKKLHLDGVTWSGWVLGPNDVWVLEDRGHSPDQVLFYVPEHGLLYTADATYMYFPTWPDSDGLRARKVLQKCQALAEAGVVQLLADAHNTRAYRGRDEIVPLLKTLLADNTRFRTLIQEILQVQDGLTVGEIYGRLKQRRDEEPVLQKYLAHEYPRSPSSLYKVILMTLLELGYEARGPRRGKRFYRPGR
jgi:glyoxylase-like metal-dependent hydrolase (beta-lactamase superfamily II)